MYDTESMRRFVGVDLDSIPDESTICRFSHRLEKEGLTAQLFRKVEDYLIELGLIVKEGTIVDANIINSPGSNMEQEEETGT